MGADMLMRLFEPPQCQKSRARRDDGQAFHLTQFQQGLVAGNEQTGARRQGRGDDGRIVRIGDPFHGHLDACNNHLFAHKDNKGSNVIIWHAELAVGNAGKFIEHGLADDDAPFQPLTRQEA